MSSKVIAAASAILMPVDTRRSLRAESRIYCIFLKGDKEEQSISKQFSICLASFIDSVFGDFVSCFNLNLSLSKGEETISSCITRYS